MILTVLKALWSCLWVLLKPCLFVLIPFSIVFGIAFYVAYLRKKKSGTAHREVIAHYNPKADVSILTKLFVQLPRQYWDNYYNIKVGEFRKHGIIMYTGKQGMGKTLTMTHDILQLKYQYPSLKIGTNYGLNNEDFVIDDWRKLVDYNNGKLGVLCAIDECQNWFSSAQSKNFPPRMLATVTQNRKNKRVIFMTSHFFTNVSKPIRLHCTEVRQCRTFLKCFTVVKRSEPIMNGDGDVIKMRKLGYYCFVHNKELYSAYDTYKVIKNLSESGFKNDTWAEDNDTTVLQPAKKKLRRQRKQDVERDVMRSMDDCFNLMNGGDYDF